MSQRGKKEEGTSKEIRGRGGGGGGTYSEIAHYRERLGRINNSFLAELTRRGLDGLDK